MMFQVLTADNSSVPFILVPQKLRLHLFITKRDTIIGSRTATSAKAKPQTLSLSQCPGVPQKGREIRGPRFPKAFKAPALGILI